MFESNEVWGALTVDERLALMKEGLEETAVAVAQLVNFQTKVSESFLKAVQADSKGK